MCCLPERMDLRVENLLVFFSGWESSFSDTKTEGPLYIGSVSCEEVVLQVYVEGMVGVGVEVFRLVMVRMIGSI